MKPAERSACGQPFVGIAQHDHEFGSLFGNGCDEPFRLMAAFGAAKPEVGNDHARCFASNIEVHIQGATGLSPGHAQVEATHRKDRPGGEEGVAAVSIMTLNGRPGNRCKPCGIGQLFQLVAILPVVPLALHLLEADDIRHQLQELLHQKGEPLPQAALAVKEVERGDRYLAHGCGSRRAMSP